MSLISFTSSLLLNPGIAGARRIPTPQSVHQHRPTLESGHTRNIIPAKPRRQSGVGGPDLLQRA